MSYNDGIDDEDYDDELEKIRAVRRKRERELEVLKAEEEQRLREREERLAAKKKRAAAQRRERERYEAMRRANPDMDSAFGVEYDDPEDDAGYDNYASDDRARYDNRYSSDDRARYDTRYASDDYDEDDTGYSSDDDYEDDEYEYAPESIPPARRGTPDQFGRYEKERRSSAGSGRPDERGARRRKSRKKKKNPMGRFFRIIIAFILIIGLLFVAAVSAITGRFDHLDTEVSKRPGAMKGNIVNILLVGQDAREGEQGQRSDSMMILSINTKAGTVELMSVMRDMYVQIPGYGGNRVNASFAWGGYDLLDKTLEDNLAITIDGNAEVDFEGFIEAMTAVGDLELELSAEEAAYMNANSNLGSADDTTTHDWNLQAGVQKLSPDQVLAYSRMRYVGNSDWERTERQRRVISAALGKIKRGHILGGYKAAYKAAPSISTDMNTWGMLRMALGILVGGEPQSYQIPAEGTYSAQYVDGMAVLVPDLPANQALIQEYMSGKYSEEE